MTSKDISTILRFMGVVEGVAVGLTNDAQSLLFDYLDVIDAILDREEKNNAE